MIQETQLPHVYEITTGYLATPNEIDFIGFGSDLNSGDLSESEHDLTNWLEYVVVNCAIYPAFLELLIAKGIAFIWQYEFTEDFAYYAYNFPTEDKPVNSGHFSTLTNIDLATLLGDSLEAVNATSAANLLLSKLGVTTNGYY